MSARTLEDLAREDAGRKTGASGAPPVNAPAHQLSKPVVVTSAGLLAARFPPREQLLSPWLLSQSLSMIYAPRGVGKTHASLGIAHALGTGGNFLGWKARQQVGVLYVDGEMPGADLRGRWERIVSSSGTGPVGEAIRFMTPDLQHNGIMPNLFTLEGQDGITAAAESSQVIIIDNLSALVRGGKENEGESWQPVAQWALAMRASGRSVVFIHHAGKTGQQRGTSKREDLLDTVIALRRPADYEPDQGARFEVHFEKARALYGEDVTPIEASLINLPNGKQEWSVRQVSDASDDQIIELAELGLSSRDIGGELGVNHSTIVRSLKRLQGEGRYTPKARNKGGRPKLVVVSNGPCPRCAGEGCGHCEKR
ncbi:MAG TPA: AAA family ATPase [Chiayiivirga sp.]|nr:AAA family ATPase [Chiayiivirga sp.]